MTIDFLGRSLYYYRVHVLPALIIIEEDEEIIVIVVDVILEFPSIK